MKEQRIEFWALYWEKLSILEDSIVSAAMVNFGNELKKGEAKDTTFEAYQLKNLSYALALACRQSLMKTWPLPMQFETLIHPKD